MSVSLLKLVSRREREGGVVEYLLSPDLPPQYLYSPLFNAVVLASLCRLRRERPYVAAHVEGATSDERHESGEFLYLRSLPKIQIVRPAGTVDLTYVGQGDFSALMPNSNDDFVLFFPEPPPPALPGWPDLVAIPNAVLVGLSDEFVTLETVDANIRAFVEGFPSY
jgi:hypothetical protein